MCYLTFTCWETIGAFYLTLLNCWETIRALSHNGTGKTRHFFWKKKEEKNFLDIIGTVLRFFFTKTLENILFFEKFCKKVRNFILLFEKLWKKVRNLENILLFEKFCKKFGKHSIFRKTFWIWQKLRFHYTKTLEFFCKISELKNLNFWKIQKNKSSKYS